MDWLIDTVDARLAIRDAAQTGTGEETQAPRNDTRFITNDITKQIAGDNNTVQRARVLDHKHSRRVDQMCARLQVRVLVLHDALERLSP